MRVAERTCGSSGQLPNLAEAIGAAVRHPELLKKTAALGLQPDYMAPSVFSAQIAGQYEHYARVIEEANIKAE